MNILMLEWDSFGQEYVIEEFQKADCEVDIFPWPFGKENMRNNDVLCQRLTDVLKEKEYRFVFSFNFFPIAARVCNQHAIKYASWIYDTPYMLLYSKYTMLDTNYIFFFDKSLFYEFKRYGVKHAFYLPMAAQVKYYDKLKKAESERYSADISFVGSTYNEARQDFFQYIDEIDEYVESVNRRRQEVLPQSEIDFMHKCEENNDYDNKRYQDDVQILNINFVDRKQPSKLYHLKDIGGSDVYHAFQGDNEFVITGKLKDWHFRDQLKNIKVPTLLTFGEQETMPISTAKIMQKEIPNSRLVTTPDGGHHHMVDNPDIYYKHLADFIREVENGSFKGE